MTTSACCGSHRQSRLRAPSTPRAAAPTSSSMSWISAALQFNSSSNSFAIQFQQLQFSFSAHSAFVKSAGNTWLKARSSQPPACSEHVYSKVSGNYIIDKSTRSSAGAFDLTTGKNTRRRRERFGAAARKSGVTCRGTASKLRPPVGLGDGAHLQRRVSRVTYTHASRALLQHGASRLLFQKRCRDPVRSTRSLGRLKAA